LLQGRNRLDHAAQHVKHASASFQPQDELQIDGLEERLRGGRRVSVLLRGREHGHLSLPPDPPDDGFAAVPVRG
jgi:hypothetical protein